MLLKKKFGIISAISISFFAHAALANDLVIQNNTNYYSSSVINGGMCSSNIPGGSGVTAPHSRNVVKDFIMRTACFQNSSNCQADVYMTNNCTGQIIATVFYDVNNGIKSITVKDSSYFVNSSAYYVEINGG